MLLLLRYFLLIVFFFSAFFYSKAAEYPVVINEFMSSNGATIQDGFGEYNDWIELYNTSDSIIDLDGMYLSDDEDDPLRWQFPNDVQIGPYDHILVWPSNKDKRDDNKEHHTNFAHSRTGEPLILTDRDGETVWDSVPALHVPRDHTYGRKPDGGDNWYYFKNPTPRDQNNTKEYEEFTEKPVFSREPGFHETSFQLTISHPDPNATIYYTLDGSEPDPANVGAGTEPVEEKAVTYIYDVPIQIEDRSTDSNTLSEINTTHNGMPPELEWKSPSETVFKGTPVRAKAAKENSLPSKLKTGTYFVTQEGNDRYELPVISVTGNNEGFFSYDNGIYVGGKHAEGSLGHWGLQDANFQQRGRSWEAPGHFELFEEEGKRSIGQNVGYRIHGNVSRAQPLKSLRTYARADYDPKNIFDYDFFDGAKRGAGDKPITNFNRLILRNSGQDFYDTYDDTQPYGTMMKDATMQEFVKHNEVGIQRNQPKIHFINGEFWGIINVRERIDRFHINFHYDIPTEDVVIYDAEHQTIGEGTHDDLNDYRDLRDFVLNYDMSQKENYETVTEKLDIKSYIDYLTIQIQSSHRHIARRGFEMWRKRTDEFYHPDSVKPGHDGQWRFKVYDLDRSFIPTSSTLERGLEPSRDNNSIALRKMVENDSFRHKFLNRFSDHLNTTFDKDRVKGIIDKNADRLEPVIEEHIGRWGYPQDKNSWNQQLDKLKEWADIRPHYNRKEFIEEFENDTAMLTVDVDTPFKGEIKVSSIDINQNTPGIDKHPYPWTGIYFTDVELPIKAKPFSGHEFVKWKGTNNTDPEIFIDFDADTTLKAVFQNKEFEYPEPHILSEEDYHFENMSSLAPNDSLPASMDFYHTGDPVTKPNSPITGNWRNGYTFSGESGISGADENGIAFYNSGKDNESEYAGAAILAIDTRNADNPQIIWKAGVANKGDIPYQLKLEYRTGREDQFEPMIIDNDTVLFHSENHESGSFRNYIPISLPEYLHDESEIQLRWRYVHPGDESGEGPKIHLSEIIVSADSFPPTGVPQLVSPKNDIEGLSITPTLKWEDVENANTYEMQLATDEDFENLFRFEEDLTDNDFELPGLATGQQYFWRVRAHGTKGPSNWSDTWTFTSAKQATPEQVQLVSPDDNFIPEYSEIEFVWHRADGADKYQLEIDSANDFENSFHNVQTNDTSETYDIPESEWDTLFWRVTGINDIGHGSASETRTIVKEHTNILSDQFNNHQKLNIYPNPAENSVTFELQNPGGETTVLRIVNMQGRKMYERKKLSESENMHKVDVSEWEQGLYKVIITGSSFRKSELLKVK